MKYFYNTMATSGESGADATKETSTFKRILPQVLASFIKDLLLVDLGLAAAFPTIVIPALKKDDPNETIKFSAEQATWYASVAYVCVPLGNIITGLLLERIGRKRAFLLVCVPFIAGWIIMHFSDFTFIYIAAVFLGIGTGCIQAPSSSYVGEICEKSVRGIITTYSVAASTIGFLIIFFLNTCMHWRTVALIGLGETILTGIALCFIPESPHWLLVQNRKEDAMKSLQWLRGWTSQAAVEKEFSELQIYCENVKKCFQCQNTDNTCNHPPPTVQEKFKELFRKETMKPFFLVNCCFFFSFFTGIHSMRAYIIPIFIVYETPIEPKWTTVIFGVITLLGTVTCMCIVRVIKKRKLSLISTAGVTISLISLGIYAFLTFPPGQNSFHPIPTPLTTNKYTALAMILFLLVNFFSYLGLGSIPWMLMAEVFPLSKSRAIATAAAAATAYIMAFVSTKIYLQLEQALSLSGVALFYGGIGIISFFYYFFMLPETENRTLEEIEAYFARKDGKFTDVHIDKKNVND